MKFRTEIANLIFDKININKEDLKNQFEASKKEIGFFFLDDLLPKEFALEIYKKFPRIEETVKRNSFREFKHTAYQIDKYDALLESLAPSYLQRKLEQGKKKL